MPPPIDAARIAAPGAFTFFFYGTLCDDDVRAAVIGRAIAVAPAVLADYEAVPAEHARYPILLFQRGREATGVLCTGLGLGEAARLGFFEHEGRDYEARELSVRDEAGGARRAWAFVPTAASRRGPGRWDLAEWQRFAKRDFLVRAQRTMRMLEPKDLGPYLELWRVRGGAGGPATGRPGRHIS
jgi:hypothetical protein